MASLQNLQYHDYQPTTLSDEEELDDNMVYKLNTIVLLLD